jgi:hypothetical protein
LISHNLKITQPDSNKVLSRVLGQVDPEQIKHDQQIDVQHTLYSLLNEQWEGFIQHLTTQSVRQATVKTADDRLAVIWSEKMRKQAVSPEEIERVILELKKKHGYALNL